MSDKKAILLRIPRELWERLNAWAADELRSVNGQIEFVLREALRRRSRDGGNVEGQTVNRQKREGGHGGSQQDSDQQGEEETVSNQNVNRPTGEGGNAESPKPPVAASEEPRSFSGKEIIARAIHEYARKAGNKRRGEGTGKRERGSGNRE